MMPKLILADGTELAGKSFGHASSTAGEVVFITGMTGYPQAFTDPSFAGQILVLTYPIIGSYGVPEKFLWESEKIQIAGLIVSSYINTPSHHTSTMSLSSWLKKAKVPALEIKDTRFLTQHLRDNGVMLGKILIDKQVKDFDPNQTNIVAHVSTKKIEQFNANARKAKTILMLDCGAKRNIERCFLKRGVTVIKVPWNFDPFEKNMKFDALFISNGPGDPKNATATITIIKKALANNIPTLGICLGNQLLALAAGGDTYKLKFGHRSQNQPCLQLGTNRCYITTQNHGFAIGNVPPKFKTWFINANDKSIEGIKHETKPFMSVQFHPEASPGPMDTEWIFDYFLNTSFRAK
jgi:carbamoyl-phosphate synthase small subunit